MKSHALQPSPVTHLRRHALLRGGRWHLAQVESRALWTTASPAELGELLARPPLRALVEELLRLAADAVDGVSSLLLFDADGLDVEATVTLERDGTCRWRWMTASAVA